MRNQRRDDLTREFHDPNPLRTRAVARMMYQLLKAGVVWPSDHHPNGRSPRPSRRAPVRGRCLPRTRAHVVQTADSLLQSPEVLFDVHRLPYGV